MNSLHASIDTGGHPHPHIEGITVTSKIKESRLIQFFYSHAREKKIRSSSISGSNCGRISGSISGGHQRYSTEGEEGCREKKCTMLGSSRANVQMNSSEEEEEEEEDVS